MPDNQIYTAIGLMSGSSHDGVDAALIKTDGYHYIEPIMSVTTPYVRDLREKISNILNLHQGSSAEDLQRVKEVEDIITRAHNATIYELLAKSGVAENKIDFIGFHGHTIHHDPDQGITCQIGNAQMMADEFGIPVIADFRTADVKAGGQGAPLAPVYHHARAGDLEKPLGIVNLGGVANLTYLGTAGEIIAFDSGPANALIDDWVYQHTGENFDKGGEYAKQGRVNGELLAKWLDHPYFKKDHKKSLDRNDFDFALDDAKAASLSLEDGAATLTAFTVDSVVKALNIFPASPTRWLISGGGRHNEFMMYALMRKLDVPVEPVEAVGWNGDAVEAECFGYLAVRRFMGEPISFPTTTGVPSPMTGGDIFEPTQNKSQP